MNSSAVRRAYLTLPATRPQHSSARVGEGGAGPAQQASAYDAVVGERISLLVNVKAYPAVSEKYGEVVCVAGIRTDTEQPTWVRLYPIAFRDLPFRQRFHKYQHVSVEASRHSGDPRPETFRPNIDTLQVGEIVKTKKAWDARRRYVEPLIVESMCAAQRQQEVDGTSLAAFRPGEVMDLLVDDEADAWDPDKAGVVAQPSLFMQTKKGLEKIPYRFRYEYRCSTPGCKGHAQSMIDWELAESYRSWRENYSEPVLLEKIREKFLDQMCGKTRDTIFFVGNMHQHPKSFLVLGVFWPPKQG
jgi:hypothetical protein